jgi:tRNA (guanine37-N1)-methyltransferase
MELSIGDYVLSGGELAAMVVIDAVVRLLPGALGAEDGAADETFADGLIEYPQYTRPREFRGLSVPDVLLSGNHAAIAKWRQEQRESRTKDRRPDLWQAHLKRKAQS